MAAQIEAIADLSEILPLLVECGMPVSDITPTGPPLFFDIRSGGALVAVVGLELLGSVGLLRSLAVSLPNRGHGLARELVAHADRAAAARGVDSLFLLTTSASALFDRLGYVQTSRCDAPAAIKVTQQFSSICPASSAFLCKTVRTGHSLTDTWTSK